MKILFCAEFFHPSVGGVQEVMRQLAVRMAQAGHDIVVATTHLPARTECRYQGVKIQGFEIAGNRVRGMSGDLDAYRAFVTRGNFDLVFIYAAQQWTFDALWPILPALSSRKVLVPCGYSGLHDPAYEAYFAALPDVLRCFDALIYHARNYRDFEFGERHGLVDRAVLIPNGADEQEFSVPRDAGFRQRMGIGAADQVLLTVGSLSGAKGHLELALAFEQLDLQGRRAVLLLNGNRMPGHTLQQAGAAKWHRILGYVRSNPWHVIAKRAVLTVLRRCGFEVGYFGRLGRCVRRIGKMQDRRVVLCDLPRDELVQAYLQANLFVFASYIEYSPLVLFEACAAALPFLTVPAGNAAEIVEWTAGGVLCPARKGARGFIQAEPAVLAERIRMLLNDEAGLRQLSESGHRAFQERFNWQSLSGEYLAVFERLRTD